MTNFTLSAWIKTTDAGGGRRRIFSQQDDDVSAQYYGIGLNGNNLECYSQLDINVGQFNRLLNDDQWHHVACVRNTKVEFVWYIDGVRVKTVPLQAVAYSPNGYALGNGGILIGKYLPSDSENFRGAIDDVRVYNISLTDEQISQVYNFTRNMPATFTNFVPNIASNLGPFSGVQTFMPYFTVSDPEGIQRITTNLTFNGAFYESRVPPITSSFPLTYSQQAADYNSARVHTFDPSEGPGTLTLTVYVIDRFGGMSNISASFQVNP
jgi:hypothetical protein